MLAGAEFVRDRTGMSVDPLSEILRLANAQSVLSGSLVAGGSWAVRFPGPDKVKFFGVVRGDCRLHAGGDAEPVRMGPGDAFLLAAPESFVLSGGAPTVPLDSRHLPRGPDTTLRVGQGEEAFLLGGHVTLEPATGDLLWSALPRRIVVRAGSPQAAAVQWILGQLVCERTEDRPGAAAASNHLAQLMFVQILRAHLEEGGSLPGGWLRALGDARIAPALRLMHGEPARAWTVNELARAVAMSRTTFSLRFHAAAGVPPLTYLLGWRMRLARHALREEKTSVAALARSLGYASESAFSNAFKRVVGMSPRRYRDAARVPPPAAGVATVTS